jgi:chromosome segregation ATPase
MVKSNGEGKESYYTKVKVENEELKRTVAWLDSDSFLLDSSADIRQVYMFLKKYPESAKFIFKKYKSLQPVIKELCDPDNPIYLEGVKNALSGIVQFEDTKEETQKIKAELVKTKNELQKIMEETEELTKQYDEICDKVNGAKKELEEKERNMVNIRADPGLEKINEFFEETKKTFDTIQEKWKKEFTITNQSIRIDRVMIDHISLLQKMENDLMEYIKTEDFLSTDNLDQYHKELLDKIRKEKESAENEIQSFMLHNPKKLIPKAIDNINLSVRLFNKSPDMNDLKYFNRIGQNQVLNPLNEAVGLLEHLQDQV